MQTISGLVPQSSSLVHPPILKVGALRGARPAANQTSLHLANQFNLVRGSHLPSFVLNAKRGAPAGTLAFTDKWRQRAGTGDVGLLRSVKMMSAPLDLLVLDHGM